MAPIYSDVIDVDFVKPPWRPEDQSEEDIGFWILRRPEVEMEELQDPAQGDEDLEPELQVWVPDQLEEVAQAPEEHRDLHHLQVQQLVRRILPDRTERLAIEYEGNDHDSSDSSEYHQFGTPQRNEEEYFWDEEEEVPSFASGRSASSEETTAQVPPGWPPRRLSSECTNQIEVTLLPGTSNGAGGYFNQEAMVNMRIASQAGELVSQADTIGQAILASDSENLGETEEAQLSASAQGIDTHLLAATDQSDISVFSSPSDSSFSDSNNSGNQPKSSARLKKKKKVDYRNLDSRGRPGSE